jgi:hypothetical protein
MDTKGLNKALLGLIEKRNALSQLSYDDTNYDTIEEELHDLEDSFIDTYGNYLEQVLADVHSEFCPDSDVLLPTAYLAKKYENKGLNPDGTTLYDVSPKEGVWVDADRFPGQQARLVFVPNPARILLMVGKQHRQEVWRAE